MIKWNLRRAMAEKGVWSAQELLELLEKKAGVILSHSAVAALLREQPKAVRFTTLEALCMALGCEPWDLMEYVPEKALRKRKAIGEEEGPVAPYRRKLKTEEPKTLYPEEDF